MLFLHLNFLALGVFFVFRKKGGRAANLFLGLFLINIFLSNVHFYITRTYGFNYKLISDFSNAFGFFYQAYLTYFCIGSIYPSRSSADIVKKNFWHLIPSILGLLYFLPYLLQLREQPMYTELHGVYYYEQYPLESQITDALFFMCINAYVIGLLVYVIIKRKELQNLTADYKRVDFGYLIEFFWMLIGLAVFATSGFVFGYSPQWFEWIPLATYMIYAYLVVRMVMRHTGPTEDDIHDDVPTEDARDAGKKYYTDDHLHKLLHCLKETKPYTNPELNLKTLAEQLEMQPYQLSQLINKEYGKNFFQFINMYRVEEVTQLLTEPSVQHLKLEAIGEQAGFSSKSSFYRIFKDYTGQTPSSYKPGVAKNES